MVTLPSALAPALPSNRLTPLNVVLPSTLVISAASASCSLAICAVLPVSAVVE